MWFSTQNVKLIHVSQSDGEFKRVVKIYFLRNKVLRELLNIILILVKKLDKDIKMVKFSILEEPLIIQHIVTY